MKGLGLLLALAACGKGSGPSQTTPPGPSTVEPPGPEPSGDDDPASTTTEPAPVEQAAAEGREEAIIDGVRLLLSSDCTLTATFLDEERSHAFAFPGECHFANDQGGSLRIVGTDHGKAILVESSEPDGSMCDTALQLVVITEKGPELSQQVQRVGMCAPQVWDEMMFHVMSADRVAFGTPAG